MGLPQSRVGSSALVVTGVIEFPQARNRMKQDTSAISRRSTNARIGAVLLTFLAVAAPQIRAAAAPPKAAPARAGQPLGPAPGWNAGNEFSLSGTYAETCTDPPLCPGVFGSNRPGPGCRKVMVFQITGGQWHGTSLANLSVAVVAEAKEGETVMSGKSERWPLCELWLPESADSAQREGLTRVLGLMVLGPGGPDFTRVERVPLATGFTSKRIFVEAVERLRLVLVPAPSINGTHPPDLSNVGRSFRFLGPMLVYEADTLYVAPTDVPPTATTRRSALVASFGWSSEAAYVSAAEAASGANR